MNDLESIKNILVCPACRSGLVFKQYEIACTNCNRVYPVRENIPQFDFNPNDNINLKEVSATSHDNYEKRYVDFEKARNYNLKYDRKLLKRLNTLREYHILKHLLGQQKHCAIMLEIPCGGGRISPRLAVATDLLIQADIGLGQILYAMNKDKLNIPQIWMTASAFCIPLHDCSVDASICIRLSHHLVTAKQRESLLVELLRVSRHFVIMTYFDHHSIKNILRKVRGKKPKLTMTTSQIATLAAAHGATLVANPWLSIVGSGHRYALLQKNHN
jgi:ubiquinone/menaquinone biosynthesis C-methylase UbiE